MADNVSQACAEYNALAEGASLPKIEVLRMPLVSGGAFAGECPKDLVAEALIRGLMHGYCENSPDINFSFDDDIFKHTWGTLSQ